MPFYTKAAQVVLIILGLLVAFLILAGIVIIAAAFTESGNTDDFLSIMGVIGSVATLWAVVIVPLGRLLLRRIRGGE